MGAICSISGLTALGAYRAGKAVAGRDLEVCDFMEGDAGLFGVFYDGFCYRVLALLFE